MCFSATASFAAGSFLTLSGTAAIIVANTPARKAFGSIPLLFAIQQFAEGFVWLGLSGPGFQASLSLATWTFLIFAQVVWALWIPVSLVFLEADRKRKKLLYGLVVIGLGISAYHIWGLVSHPISGKAVDCHIHYNVDYLRKNRLFSGFIYGVATIIPCFVSSIKRMWWLGTAFLLSYLATQHYYDYFVISIWCYFAALLSVLVIFILLGIRNLPAKAMPVQLSNT